MNKHEGMLDQKIDSGIYIKRDFHVILFTSEVCSNTEFSTEMISVFFVKDAVDIPSSPFNCCSPMVMAAPPMNPTIAAWERKSTMNPSLQKRNHPINHLQIFKP